MNEIGGGINNEIAVPIEATKHAVAQTTVEQKPKEGLFERVKRILTFSGSIVNEAQNAPQSLNPRSTTPPRPSEPQPQTNQTFPNPSSPEKV